MGRVPVFLFVGLHVFIPITAHGDTTGAGTRKYKMRYSVFTLYFLITIYLRENQTIEVILMFLYPSIWHIRENGFPFLAQHSVGMWPCDVKRNLPKVWKEKVKITAVAAHVLFPDITRNVRH